MNHTGDDYADLSNLYPIPRSLSIIRGLLESGSILDRNLWTYFFIKLGSLIYSEPQIFSSKVLLVITLPSFLTNSMSRSYSVGVSCFPLLLHDYIYIFS